MGHRSSEGPQGYDSQLQFSVKKDVSFSLSAFFALALDYLGIDTRMILPLTPVRPGFWQISKHRQFPSRNLKLGFSANTNVHCQIVQLSGPFTRQRRP